MRYNVNQKIISQYCKYYDGFRVERFKVALFLGALFVPSYSFLDLISYPDQALNLILSRAVTSILIILLFLFSYKINFKKIRALCFSYVILLILSIDILIFLGDGSSSPYYAGLSLIIVAVAVLLMFEVYDTAILCVITLMSYILTIFLYSYFNNEKYNVPILINNLSFLVTVSVTCIVSSYFNSKTRFENFCQKFPKTSYKKI
jgi:hypothetical protein